MGHFILNQNSLLEFSCDFCEIYKAKQSNILSLRIICYSTLKLISLIFAFAFPQGKRSCQSDVWSYGVTVWEVLTRCKDVPYADLTSEQVLENCGLWYHSSEGSKGKRPRLLEQPMFCTGDLYRLMLRCWCKCADDRPSFQEIHCYLKKLTLD